jgi:hypothetical protein
MSLHAAFRRQAVQPQIAEQLEPITVPAPTRGLALSENETFMSPGGAIVMDNWRPTLKGCSARGGHLQWAALPETTPIYSGFSYQSGSNRRMFVGNATKLYDVTSASATLVKSGQTSGNYSVAQLANAAGDFLTVVNDGGDPPLRFDGTTWTTLNAGQITGPGGSAVATGTNLVCVCKYRSRLFFIEKNSMNAWYLGLNAIGGVLAQIPLSGAATMGGKLLFCATWSIDAGDGIDDKIVFGTDLGELIIFTGGDPSVATDWRQEGRYDTSPPLGQNATIKVGGDLLIATVDGIIPTSAAITKSKEELELAAITRNIKPMWDVEVANKRAWPWTMNYWHDYGAIFVTTPGGASGEERCLLVNAATGAWARYTAWDATCFINLGPDMFFGTQRGKVMQADRTGKDNGAPYVCTLVGGWEMFQAPAQTITWYQARAAYLAGVGQVFNVQLSCAVDYVATIPPPPLATADPGLTAGWDIGLWDTALWDAAVAVVPNAFSTGWVSIGVTGYSHAPIVQLTIAQNTKPTFHLISIGATFKRMGVNV